MKDWVVGVKVFSFLCLAWVMSVLPIPLWRYHMYILHIAVANMHLQDFSTVCVSDA